jgi:hypothetical protein
MMAVTLGTVHSDVVAKVKNLINLPSGHGIEQDFFMTTEL